MKLEETIVSDLAFDIKQQLVQNVRENLTKDSTLFLQKEVCLTNRWEEFCVCLQDKRMHHLQKSYKPFIAQLFATHFNALKRYEKISVWLKTKEGIAWIYDNKMHSYALEEVAFDFEACAEDLYVLIEEKAGVFDNDTIYRFIYLDCNAFENNFDEDDKDIIYE